LTGAIFDFIIHDEMNHKERRQKLSPLRRQLQQLLRQLQRRLEPAFQRTAIVKGNVYDRAYRCQAKHCACQRGQLHRDVGLTWSEPGRRRFRQVPPGRVVELRRKSRDYLRLRQARAAVTVLSKKITGVLDQIEAVRREAAFHE
jgi:hypothetical protein